MLKLAIATSAALVAGAAIYATAQAAPSPLRLAVIALHSASAKVQEAVDRDTCTDERSERFELGRRHLSPRNARAYDQVKARLGAALDAAPPTRAALGQLRIDWCNAVANR